MINFFKAFWSNIKFLIAPTIATLSVLLLGALLELWTGLPQLVYLLIVLIIILIVVSIIDAINKTKITKREILCNKIEELESKIATLKEEALNTNSIIERERIYIELHETISIVNEMRNKLENM